MICFSFSEKFLIIQDRDLTQKHLHEVSAHLSTPKKFTDVAVELGLKLNETEIIRTDNPDDIRQAAFKMLVNWHQRFTDVNEAWRMLNFALQKWIPSHEVMELYEKLASLNI